MQKLHFPEIFCIVFSCVLLWSCVEDNSCKKNSNIEEKTSTGEHTVIYCKSDGTAKIFDNVSDLSYKDGFIQFSYMGKIIQINGGIETTIKNRQIQCEESNCSPDNSEHEDNKADKTNNPSFRHGSYGWGFGPIKK